VILTVLATLTPLLVIAPTLRSDAADAQRWSKVTRWSVVRDQRIDEASGISRSTYHRGLVYLHNDSGDVARFFAIGAGGRTKAVFRVRHVVAHDWEDMAAGPHHTLWFGDIGDNGRRRATISVVRVREPREMHSRSVRGRVFSFRYVDGPHNAEALLVRPRTGRVYVVTKASPHGKIYRAPRHLSRTHVNLLRPIASAPPIVTGGDFAPNGKTFVLRTYRRAFLYSTMGGRPTPITLPSESMGEAIGFTRGARAIKVASEGLDQPIWRIAR
jgi:hypothetical protein